MSKLYTEKQVQVMLQKLTLKHYHNEDNSYTSDFLIEEQKPIELPTDEEIERQSKLWGIGSEFFYKGANWVRDKIKGGNNE